MPKSWTLTEAFKYFGATGANPRWSWSARSDDGDVVVMTLWKDQLDYSGEPIKFDCFGDDGLSRWKDKPGNRERAKNLKWALDNCGGEFRVVVTVAKDAEASPRVIQHCYPVDRLIMKIVKLNDDTGEFIAVNIGK
jgi:hypothetical protein